MSGMTGMSALRAGTLAAVLAGLLVAGCGSVHDDAGGVGSAVPGGSARARWVSYGPAGPELVSVSEDGSGRVLAVAVQVPAGPDGCLRDLTGGLSEFGATVAYVSVAFQSRLASVAGACPSDRVMTVHVRLPGLLGHREVMINSDTTTVFAPDHGAVLRRCGEDGCGPFAPPPPATCGTRSYQQAMLSTGPPMDAVYQVLGCDGRWLVLDVGWPGGASGCDGPSCNPDMVSTRWFFRASRQGWVPIVTALTAGCAAVLKAEPRFPARLCASLPAPG
jgi:hypothetical protein